MPAPERTHELGRVKEAFAATALVCHWLVRDRARRLAALNAACEELRVAREEREAAIVRRDAILAERAALDGELKRLVGKCERLAQEHERASVQRDRAKREHERAVAELQQVQTRLIGARSERPHEPTEWSLVPSSAWRLAGARAADLLRSFVRPAVAPRAVAMGAILAVLVVLLIMLSS